MVEHIVKYSLPYLRVTYIFSQRPTVNSLSAITAQTRECTKTYKRVLIVVPWLVQRLQLKSMTDQIHVYMIMFIMMFIMICFLLRT